MATAGVEAGRAPGRRATCRRKATGMLVVAGRTWSLYRGHCSACGKEIGAARSLSFVVAVRIWDSIRYDGGGLVFADHDCPGSHEPGSWTTEITADED